MYVLHRAQQFCKQRSELVSFYCILLDGVVAKVYFVLTLFVAKLYNTVFFSLSLSLSSTYLHILYLLYIILWKLYYMIIDIIIIYHTDIK